MKKKQNKKDPSSNQSNVSDDQPISNSKQSLPDSPELSKSETQVTNSEHIIEQSSNETQQIKEEKEIIHPDLSIDEKVKFESTKATNVDKIPTSSTASGWTLSGVVENVNVTDQIQQPLMQIHEIGNPLLGFRRTFPALLFKILLMQHDPSILDWMPDGKSFVIKKPALFAQFIAPQYFNRK